MDLPDVKNLLLRLEQGVLHMTFNRPESRNAMSLGLLQDIVSVFDAISSDRGVRAVAMRGAGGHFCAGGDIKDMANARAAKVTANGDPVAEYNRQFGRMLRKVNHAPQATLAVLEGAVLGGGFGLACVTDVAIAHRDASFGMPETGLGIPPAQIAPFVVERLGLSQARRLAVCGARFKGEEALRLGLVHFVVDDEAQLNQVLQETLTQIRRCAPGANATTKEIMLSAGRMDMDAILDYAAKKFSEAVRGPEGVEGTTAFVQKRLPKWAE
ncbi:MAG: enoyl-CoA hydratase/isomerase family protein [Nevskiales bacterium]